MDSPFSALVEWLTSPQVVGSFTIGIVGVLASAILWGFAVWLDSDVFAVLSILIIIVTVVCLLSFNAWVVGVV